jgi:hypothetical protein
MEVFHAIPSNALKTSRYLLRDITKSIVAEDIEDVFYNMRERGTWWRKEDYDFLYKTYIDALSDAGKVKRNGGMKHVLNIHELLEDLGEDYQRGRPELRYSWKGTELVTEKRPFDRGEMLEFAVGELEPAALELLSSDKIGEEEISAAELDEIRKVYPTLWAAILENSEIWIYKNDGGHGGEVSWLSRAEREELLGAGHAQ